MRRLWSPALVHALAALATLATLAYIAGLYSLFAPGEPLSWRDNFAGNVLVWMYIPFALWLVYMYARVTLGRRLIEQGRAEEALGWSLPRVQPNIWLRTQREALVHRVVVAQALLRLGRWDQALVMTQPPAALLPPAAAELSELVRWRVELLLCRQDYEAARRALESHTPAPRADAAQRAALLALLAEVCVIEGQYEQARKHVEDAAWRDKALPRVAFVRALLVSRVTAPRSEIEAALAGLIAAHEALAAELPARAAELWALRAQLYAKLEQPDLAAEARVAERDALTGAPDARAVSFVEEVTK
jgi:tetratricopeptide (TPR) repeat protein